MNKFQKAYALAKAHHEVTVDLYNQEFKNDAEYNALAEEQAALIDFEPGTPEYERAVDIEERLEVIERAIDERTAYTRSREVLQEAEQAMVEWSFAQLKQYPEAFKMAGASFSDITVLQDQMKNLYSPVRKKLVDLAFRYAG